MEVIGAVSLAVGVSALVTFGGTKLWDAYRMEKKYQTNKAAGECMAAREAAESDVISMLQRVEKRLQLGNLAIGDLWEHAKLPPEKLLQYEKALEIKLRDEDQTG